MATLSAIGVDFKLVDSISDSDIYNFPEFTFSGRGGGLTVFGNYDLSANPAVLGNDVALGLLNPVLYGVAPDSNRELAFVSTSVYGGLGSIDVLTNWTDASGLIQLETPPPPGWNPQETGPSFSNDFGYFAPDGSDNEGVFMGQGLTSIPI